MKQIQALKMTEHLTPLEVIQPLIRQVEKSRPIMSIDDELAVLRTMNKDLKDFQVKFDRILVERDDLRQLVADLTRERDSLRTALQQRDRH